MSNDQSFLCHIHACLLLNPIDRFGVFWFGFNYYHNLFTALTRVGFSVNPVPFVWLTSNRASQNPHFAYANSYQVALIARKGYPQFMVGRNGQSNSFACNSVGTADKLQIAQQPEGLVKKFIEDMTTGGATIVDFCAGSGTTGIAAAKLGRSAILFERDQQCINVIKARLTTLPTNENVATAVTK